jgi:hypothetical protein
VGATRTLSDVVTRLQIGASDDPGDFKDKAIVLTGASSGTGRSDCASPQGPESPRGETYAFWSGQDGTVGEAKPRVPELQHMRRTARSLAALRNPGKNGDEAAVCGGNGNFVCAKRVAVVKMNCCLPNRFGGSRWTFESIASRRGSGVLCPEHEALGRGPAVSICAFDAASLGREQCQPILMLSSISWWWVEGRPAVSSPRG